MSGCLMQDQLLCGLNTCLASLLRQCCWPPPLANDPHARPNPNKRPRPASASAEGFTDLPSPEGQSEAPLEDLQTPGAEGRGEWGGFDGAGPAVSLAPHSCMVVRVGTRGGELLGRGWFVHCIFTCICIITRIITCVISCIITCILSFMLKTELWSAHCLYLQMELCNFFPSLKQLTLATGVLCSFACVMPSFLDARLTMYAIPVL